MRQRKKAQLSVVKQFDKVTEGLERIQATIGVELERAAETGKVAESTSAPMKNTLNEHGTLGSRVDYAKSLVNKFRRRYGIHDSKFDSCLPLNLNHIGGETRRIKF